MARFWQRLDTMYLRTNLEAHRHRWGGSIEGVEDVALDDPLAAAILRTGDGHALRVHGRSPLEEARAWLAGAIADSPVPDTICVIGAGHGWIVDAIAERSTTTRVLVLEPEPSFASRFLARRDWSALIAAGRLLVLVGPEFRGADGAWRILSPSTADPLNLVHPVIARARPEGARAAGRVLGRALRDVRGNEEARRTFAAPYLLNTLRNLGHLARSRDAGRLVDEFTDVPAILVGAGPSLDASLPELARAADRALVIAADTALRPLLAAGIEPALVVAVDPSPTNARHLVDLPPCRETWLVTEPSVAREGLEPFAERLFTFRVAEHEPWPWLMGAGIDRVKLHVFGSVLTVAFDLALRAGCNPVLFAGADLAYTGGQPYCRRATWERQWSIEVARGRSLRSLWRDSIAARPNLEEQAIDGSRVVTAPHLVAFRDHLRSRIEAEPSRRFVNATPGGILMGPRIELATIDEALKDCPPQSEPSAARVRRLFQRDGLQKSSREQALRDAVKDLVDAYQPSASVPTIQTWRNFGYLDVDDQVIAALCSGAADLDERSRGGEAVAGLPGGGSRTWLPDADLADYMRAFLIGPDVEPDDVALGPPTLPSDIAAFSMTIDEALENVLALDAPIATDVVAGVTPDMLHSMPPSQAFAWTAGARALAVRFEETALRSVASHLAVAGVQEPAFFQRPIMRDVGVSASVSDGADVDLRARLALAIVAAAAHHKAAPDAEKPQRVLAVRVLRAVARVAEQRAASTGAPPTPAERRGRVRLPFGPDVLMRALTGVLVRHGGHRVAEAGGASLPSIPFDLCASSDDPRVPFLSSSELIEPELIYDDMGRPCLTVFEIDGKIMFSLGAATESWLVDEHGPPRPWLTWPRIITGAMPIDGGLVAWSQWDRILLHVDRAGDVPSEIPVPFRPMRATTLPDGRLLWCTVNEGLWTWRPGHEPEQMLETPTLINALADDQGLILFPVKRDGDGPAQRCRLVTGWTCPRGATSLHEIALGPEGQCTARVADKAWTAHVHPYADIVRLTHADGARVDLGCYFPLSAAWLDGTLFVATAEGTLLRFRGLAQRLRPREETALAGADPVADHGLGDQR